MVNALRQDFQQQVEIVARRMLEAVAGEKAEAVVVDVAEAVVGDEAAPCVDVIVDDENVAGRVAGGMRALVPIALAMLDGQAWTGRVVWPELMRDHDGHHRAEYEVLARHLVAAGGGNIERCARGNPSVNAGECGEKSGKGSEGKGGGKSGGGCGGESVGVGEGLWWAMLAGDDDRVDACLSHPDSAGALHEMGPDESLDAWTYQELVGLHALHRLARRSGRDDWHERLRMATHYHLENTQPDNATTQPWGLPAFASFADTQCFAEQQLHDAMTQGDACVSGLLLADAAVVMRRVRGT